jgi:hypothetical protein
MRTLQLRWYLVLAIGLGVAVFASAVYSKKFSFVAPRTKAQQTNEEAKRLEAQRRNEENRHLQALPKVVSKTPSLRITHMEIVWDGVTDLLRVTVYNKSEKSIKSFTISTRLEKSGGESITFGGPEGTSLAPHSEISVDIAAGNIRPNKPLTLSAVVFMDGSEEGIRHVRDIVRGDAEKKQHPLTPEDLQ